MAAPLAPGAACPCFPLENGATGRHQAAIPHLTFAQKTRRNLNGLSFVQKC
jgi:hypothetical protein